MFDIVERLRDTADVGVPDFTHSGFMREAADTIEALRAENKRLREALKPFADEASVGPMPGKPNDPRECSMKFLLAAKEAMEKSNG